MIDRNTRAMTATGIGALSIAACALGIGFGSATMGTDAAHAADTFQFRPWPTTASPGETMSDVAQWFADETTKRSGGVAHDQTFHEQHARHRLGSRSGGSERHRRYDQ